MKNKLLKILPFIGIFTLGLYSLIQFILNKPIDSQIGLIITLIIVILLAIADEKDEHKI
jgi:hypothetical protein